MNDKNQYRYTWAIVYSLIFIAGIFFDQLSKNLSEQLLTVSYNSGVIFGAFANISPFIRISLVSSFFGIIFSVYLLSMYLISKKNIGFKLGLTLMVSGIGGNVYSKVVYGKTIDFVTIKTFNLSIIFNLADLLQWIGFLTCLFFLVIKREVFWQGEERRGGLIIDFREQIAYSTKLCIVSFCSSLVLGIFSFSFMRTIFAGLEIESLSGSIYAYILTYILISIFFTIIVGVAGMFLSKAFVGPIIAFERFVNLKIEGKKSPLKLRKSDRFKILEKLADKLRDI